MLDRTSCRGQDVFFDGLQKLESEMRRSLSATELKRRIDLAAGRELPELVLKNCRIVNVFTEEILSGDIAIDCGWIVGVGQYQGIQEIDLKNAYVAPGLIDAHVHLESSMVTPVQFAKAVLPHGTTTVIADPHEIANVCGLNGVRYMLEQSSEIPLDVFVMMPSCVPATPFENSGAVIRAEGMGEMLGHPRVLGLGEMMDYPGVVGARQDVLDKLVVGGAGRMIDGHGPVLTGKNLNAYVMAGVGTDHECSTENEMLQRLRLGMYIQIREGSAAKNLEALIKGVTPQNSRRVLFCTDDRHPGDILSEGHIDNNLRQAIRGGFSAVAAIRMATLNAAECYQLSHLGAIAPGYQADLIVFESLEEMRIAKVFKQGRLVAENGEALFDIVERPDDRVLNTVRLQKIVSEQLALKLDSGAVNVIRLLSHSLVTEKVVREVTVRDGVFVHDDQADILKLAVVERHKATGNIGLGLLENYGLKSGAIASTVAHDSHNLIVVGSNDSDMLTAIAEIERIGGGLTIARQGKILGSLPLPIAGLMSDSPLQEVDDKLNELLKIAYGMGVNPQLEPFMTLAFLALPVIPDIKLTDLGLFDVTRFEFMKISAKETVV
jgi:adenine deaminase